jgi:hypothetical protein
VPVVIEHGLGTFDVAVHVVKKDAAGSGASSGRPVEPHISITSADEVEVTFTGNLPAAGGLFRVLVRAVTMAEAVV